MDQDNIQIVLYLTIIAGTITKAYLSLLYTCRRMLSQLSDHGVSLVKDVPTDEDHCAKVCLVKNRFHFAVCLFGNRSQIMSKCDNIRTKKWRMSH